MPVQKSCALVLELTETLLMEPDYPGDNETGHAVILHTVNNGNVTVIPEFQSWMLLPILVGTTVIVAFVKKRYVQ